MMNNKPIYYLAQLGEDLYKRSASGPAVLLWALRHNIVHALIRFPHLPIGLTRIGKEFWEAASPDEFLAAIKAQERSYWRDTFGRLVSTECGILKETTQGAYNQNPAQLHPNYRTYLEQTGYLKASMTSDDWHRAALVCFSSLQLLANWELPENLPVPIVVPDGSALLALLASHEEVVRLTTPSGANGESQPRERGGSGEVDRRVLAMHARPA